MNPGRLPPRLQSRGIPETRPPRRRSSGIARSRKVQCVHGSIIVFELLARRRGCAGEWKPLCDADVCVEGSLAYTSIVGACWECVVESEFSLLSDEYLYWNLEAGYKALFLSVDVPLLGKRLNEYRNNYTLPEDMSWPNILSHGLDTSNRTDYGEFII